MKSKNGVDKLNYSAQTEEWFSLGALMTTFIARWRSAAAAALLGAVIVGGMGLTIIPDAPQDQTESIQAKIDEQVAESIHYQAQSQNLLSYTERIEKNTRHEKALAEQIENIENTIQDLEEEKQGMRGETKAEITLKIASLREYQADMEQRILSFDDSTRGLEESIKEITGRRDTKIDKPLKLYQTYIDDAEEEIKRLKQELKKADEPTEPKGLSVKKGIGFAVIGAVLFVGLYFLVVMVRFVFGGKLRSVEELQVNQNILVLGSIRPCSEKRNRKLDQWVQKRRGEISHEAESDAYRLIAAKLSAKCGTEQNIYLTGTVDFETLTAAAEMLTRMAEQPIKIHAVKNPAKNPETIFTLKNAANIVLMEAGEKSCKKDVYQLLETLERICETSVCGVIAC